MISDKEKYVNLSTQKKDGSFINTPVWFAQEGDTNSFYIFSAGEAGKVKRIRNFSSVKVAICDARGNLQGKWISCLLYTSPSPRDRSLSRMPSSA